jgi:nucleoside 2-deoxyribosyltransferase
MMFMDSEGRRCPLCKQQANTGRGEPVDGVRTVDCTVCGVYEIDEDALKSLDATAYADTKPLHLLSGIVKTAPVHGIPTYRITLADVDRLKSGVVVERTFSERLEALLRWVSLERPGSEVTAVPETSYPAAFCRDHNEWLFLIGEAEERKLVRRPTVRGGQGLSITGNGYEWLEARSQKSVGHQGFVAMSFSRQLERIYDEGIEPAIRTAGYGPVIIRNVEFNGGIMDRIQAEIRRSRFVVADLTENRAGVYHEAGFAAGLGIPVFYMARTDHLDPQGKSFLHFDVRHLNVTAWEETKLDDLAERLKARIQATLGDGPLLTASAV